MTTTHKLSLCECVAGVEGCPSRSSFCSCLLHAHSIDKSFHRLSMLLQCAAKLRRGPNEKACIPSPFSNTMINLNICVFLCGDGMTIT